MDNSAFKHRWTWLGGFFHIKNWSGINLCEWYSIHIAEKIIAHDRNNYVLNLIWQMKKKMSLIKIKTFLRPSYLISVTFILPSDTSIKTED